MQEDSAGVETSGEQESFDSSRNPNDEVVKTTSGQDIAHYGHFHMREIIIDLPGGAQMRFNPVVSFFAIAVLWGVAIWCMVAPDQASATIIEWKAQVTELFTWFYVGSNPAFMVCTDDD